MSEINNFNVYDSIKNGSYEILLKSYYARRDAVKVSQTGDNAQRGCDPTRSWVDNLNSDFLWKQNS
jgi:hypothetical protein